MQTNVIHTTHDGPVDGCSCAFCVVFSQPEIDVWERIRRRREQHLALVQDDY